MLYEQSVRAVDPLQLAVLSGITKVPRFSAPTPPVIRPHLLTHQLRGECHCNTLGVPPDYGRLRGLGLDPTTFDMNALQVPSVGSGNVSVLQTMAVGGNFVPGVGQIGGAILSTFTTFLNQFESWFHIGAGRREADIITPVQNNLVNNTLNGITNQILTGSNPSCDTLQSLYRQVWTAGVAFQEFVLMRQFTDRRASGQALNTIMPYIDGSCGDAVPVAFTATPTQFNCLSWGDGTVGGVGQNGMLGALARAMAVFQCDVPQLPDLHQAANYGIKPASFVPGAGGLLPATIMGVSTPLALVIGLAGLFLYKKGLF
jgi:hypothetical protein